MMSGKNHQKRNRKKRRADFLAGLRFETLEKRELLAADLGFDVTPEGEGGHSHGSDAVSGFVVHAATTQDAGGGYYSGSALGKTPIEVAESYFADNFEQYNLSEAGLGDYRVLSEYVSSHTRVTHLALQQQISGLDVFGAYVNINFDNDGSVLSAASSFVHGADVNAFPEDANVGSVEAANSAINGLGLSAESPIYDASSPGDPNVFSVNVAGIASGSINGRKVYVPVDGGINLAWEVSFQSSDGPEYYVALIDATNARFAFVADGVAHAAYKVIELPYNDLDEHPQVLANDPADPTASPFGWHDTNGTIGPEYTTTRGNNVHVVEGDLNDGFNPINYSPDGGPSLQFNYDFDRSSPNYSPENLDAAITNAFYTINMAHDVLYHYGFDEYAGNFQASNYSNPFGAGDHMRVHVQDPSEGGDPPCNAFIAGLVFGDGISPYMNLGYCNTGTIADGPIGRDFALTNDVIIHEYAHGLFERLVGGPNYGFNYIPDSQSGSMHEGTADFLAVWFTMKENQDPSDAIEAGPWVGNVVGFTHGRQNAGVRRVPYSYDMAVNPTTFDQWNDDNSPYLPAGVQVPNNEVHNGGELWATVLYDMVWEFIAKYGGSTGAENFTPEFMDSAFNPDIHDAVGSIPASGMRPLGPTGTNNIFSASGSDVGLDLNTGANNYALQLVVDGMKLAPPQPSFVEMRDSILAADIALTGGVNHDIIWKAFARRGLGYSSDPLRDNPLHLGTLALPSDPVPFSTAYDMPSNQASVTGVAYIDADGDGERDLNESPLSGVQIYVDVNNNGSHDRLEPYEVTDEDGKYEFEFFVGGEFKIRAATQPNYLQSEPAIIYADDGTVVSDSHGLYIVNGYSEDDVDFGFEPSSVSLGVFGTKYVDINGNGVQDDPALEPGLEGIYLYLDMDLDGQIDIGEPAAVTDADGNYAIEYYGAGDVRVREVETPGWEITEPAVGYHDLKIIAGIPALGVDFGNLPRNDFGDAPESYGTLLSDEGAVHGILNGFGIGQLVDAESDGITGTDALGDDIDGIDDEDGVTFASPLVNGQSSSATVEIRNGDNSPGVLQAWIDFDGNGNFDEDEQVAKNVSVVDGDNTIIFDVPSDAVIGDVYARFRYGYERDLGPTGRAMVGEVEDYRVLINDTDPNAVDDVVIVTQNSMNNQILVLGNDVAGIGGPLTITNVSAASEGGAVTIIAGGTKIAYTPPQDFISPPFETFTYTVEDPSGASDTASVSVRVTPEFNDPIAVDDYFPFVLGDADAGNISWTTLDVLANDIAGANGLAVLPSNPATAFPGLVESPEPGEYETENGCVRLTTNAAGEYQVQYKPNAGFFDMDSFEYAVFDTLGTETRANVTVQVQPNANANDEIKFTVEFPGLFDDVAVGETFTVQVAVDDDRTGMNSDDMGVFAAYMDLLYDSELVSVVQTTETISYDSEFPNGHSGNVDVPGIVNEVGAFQDTSLVQHDGPMTLYTITFRADAAGSVVFQTDPADVSPLHDTLTIEPAAPVPHNKITFGNGSVDIVGSSEGESPLDINADGDITPLDALMIINDLNEHGTHAIGGGAEGESVAYSRLDVNGDAFVSPIDALAVINYLNHGVTLEDAVEAAEGEAMAVLDIALADESCLMMPTAADKAVESVSSTTIESSADNSQYQAAEQLALALWASNEVDNSDDAGDGDALEDAVDDVAAEINDFWNEA